MKRAGVVLLAAVVAVVLARARAEDQKAEKGNSRAGDELKQFDRTITDAIAKGDADSLAKHTSDDYLLIDPVGRCWSKEKNVDALRSKTLTFDHIKDSDVKVRVYGDTALVTGLSDIKGRTKKHEIDGEYRWMRVYHKKSGGDWMCVAEQLTRVNKLEPRTKEK